MPARSHFDACELQPYHSEFNDDATFENQCRSPCLLLCTQISVTSRLKSSVRVCQRQQRCAASHLPRPLETSKFNNSLELPCSLRLWVLRWISISQTHTTLYDTDWGSSFSTQGWHFDMGRTFRRRNSTFVTAQCSRDCQHGQQRSRDKW